MMLPSFPSMIGGGAGPELALTAVPEEFSSDFKFPASVLAGDILVAVAQTTAGNSGYAPVTPIGWTAFGDDKSYVGGYLLSAAIKIANGSEAGVSIPNITNTTNITFTGCVLRPNMPVSLIGVQDVEAHYDHSAGATHTTSCSASAADHVVWIALGVSYATTTVGLTSTGDASDVSIEVLDWASSQYNWAIRAGSQSAVKTDVVSSVPSFQNDYPGLITGYLELN